MRPGVFSARIPTGLRLSSKPAQQFPNAKELTLPGELLFCPRAPLRRLSVRRTAQHRLPALRTALRSRLPAPCRPVRPAKPRVPQAVLTPAEAQPAAAGHSRPACRAAPSALLRPRQAAATPSGRAPPRVASPRYWSHARRPRSHAPASAPGVQKRRTRMRAPESLMPLSRRADRARARLSGSEDSRCSSHTAVQGG